MKALRVLTWVALLAGCSWAQQFPGVLTWHNDLARTGQNLSETTLTLANVNPTQFGKLFSFPVDGQIYTQPLYVPKVSIPGKGVRNVVYIATQHDSVYAFDADGTSSIALWHASFINPPSVTSMPCTSASQPDCDPTIITPERGVTATPVIDAAAGTIFVIAKTVENGKFTYKLHALDITTGLERSGSPVIIQAAAPGHPTTKFNPVQALDRAGVALLNRQVLVAFNSSDSDRGWLIAYDASTLAQTAVFCVTPTGQLGAIWGSGAAPAVDAEGNIYFMTGNGSFDANKGGENYSMSMLKLSLQATGFVVSDYFTPFNESQLSRKDLDLASGGVMLFPDQAGVHKHEITGGFKTGQVFLVDRDSMGEFDPQRNHVVQTILPDQCGFWSSPAYWNGHVYWGGGGSHLLSYDFVNGKYVVPPKSPASGILNYPGVTPSISANGNSNAIVWTVENPGGQPMGNPPAILRAYDATDLTKKLYDSTQMGGRDQAGPAMKFTVPTVAKGKVYFGTETELDVYGLLASQ